MSPSIKFGLMTLVSAAAAIPHHGGHSKFHHKPSGASSGAYGTGAPYPARNSTALLFGTATGAGAKTTTLEETLYSTTTEYRTVYATPATAVSQVSQAASAGVADVSTGAACGAQETIYVTATNKVTVTIGYTPSSVAESSIAPVETSSSAVYVAPSSSVVVSISIPNKGESSAAPVATSSTPAYSAPAYSAPASSAVAVSSAAPVSSAKPSSTSTPTYSGSKRGLAYNDATLCSSFSGGKYGFAYNWASTMYGQGSLPEGTEFVPMMHSPSTMSAENFIADVAKAVKSGSKAVMGFNEPDLASQANLSPEQACSDWTTYMEPLVSAHPELTIIGPSVTNGQAPMGLDWLSRFQKACPSATWHAANIHFYDQYDDKVVDRFISHCEDAAKQFGKPVWVTEFGLNPGTATEDQAADFVSKVMKYMDGSDSIKGYAYFMVGTGENQLNTASGLSKVGQAYAS